MKKFLLVLLVAGICQTGYTQHSPSSVKTYKKVFTTYDFSDPDPVAKPGAIYPYYRFDGYTNTAINKEWTVVELENDFIKVMILPEIGGKIWAAWDKATGKSFIYNNQVVKFRDVSMRGPWTSGGIEANYGIIGHTPNCATPMDYLTEKKQDGSTSCTIGTLDLLTQTYWSIEVNLPSDKAYFTTHSFWHNSTSLEQPYYTWMNAGIKASGNLEFVYPGNRYIGHSGEYADWKINKENGKNISFYEQNNFGGYKSYHVFGQYTDFFGAFWHQENFGMGRFAAHDEKAGKKIWIWGLSKQGMIWEKLLSDNDGQYVEVQSGRLFNQSAEASTFTPFKHLGFAPSVSDSWTEYWFPVKGTKGFVQASPYGALNVRVENGWLKLNLSPLQDLSEDLVVKSGASVVYSKQVNLKTLHAFADSVAFNGKGESLIVTLGGDKIKYMANAGETTLNRPVDSPADFDWNSVQGLYLQGKENIRQRFYAKGEEKLLAALTKDQHFLPALADLSMLMLRKMEYQKALDYARHALSIDTYDPAGNFYYGLAHLQLGHTLDAKDGFDIASLSGEYRSAAFLELSKIYFRENNFEKAIHYAMKSLVVNTENIGALQVLALSYRMTRQQEKATEVLRNIQALNPLSHFVRFENYRWRGTDESRTLFSSLIRHEMPQETYLQMADDYAVLGLLQESLEILSMSPVNAESLYWMAWLQNKLGKNGSAELIAKANQLSAALVFPFRSMSVEVLRWVSEQTPDWKPKYYLGLIYWSRNDLQKAKELFLQCKSDFAPFYASRAALLNGEQAEADLREAARLNPSEWRYGKLLINKLIEKKDLAGALTVAKDYHDRFPGDFRLSMQLANALLLNKQFKACAELLDKITILPYEGATDGRVLYHETWLMKAIGEMESKHYKAALSSIQTARRWPENLGVGKPYDADIDGRLENYLEGVVYKNSDNAMQAGKKWNEVIAFKGQDNNVNTLITALALKESNRREEGEEILASWMLKEPDNKMAKWCVEVFQGHKPSEEVKGNDNFRIVKALLKVE